MKTEIKDRYGTTCNKYAKCSKSKNICKPKDCKACNLAEECACKNCIALFMAEKYENEEQQKEDEANARLIAAAPSLLEASDNFIKGWKHFISCIDFKFSYMDAEAIRFMNEVPGQLVAAIAKATGKE